MNKTALVTGASGFVGQVVLRHLARAGWNVIATSRTGAPGFIAPQVRWVSVGDISTFDGWSPLLEGVGSVVHLAARAHILREGNHDSWALYHAVNVSGTLRLAQASVVAGVKRFIYVSSIGVNGVHTDGAPFTEADTPNPVGDYARSKWQAESGLHELAANSGLETVILRPPLIYGAEAPGNFARLARWVVKGWPLPLASIRNEKSLIFVENLADVIVLCCTHPRARNQVFLLSDGEDVSTPGLIEKMARAAGLRARLLPCPPWLLRLAGKLLRRDDEMQRLIGSLRIDSSHIRQALAWQPPYNLEQGVAQTMNSYTARIRTSGPQ